MNGDEIVNKKLTLFEKAKESRILLNGFLSIVIFSVILLIGQMAGGVLLGIVASFKYGGQYSLEIFNEISSGPIGLILMFIFPLLLCFTWVSIVEKRKISSLGLDRHGFLLKFIKGFSIGILLFSSVTLLMYIFGIITLDQGLKLGLKSLPGILLILPGWIIQSSTEEILTRGWFMNVVGARHKPIIGFIASSFIFGFLHISNDGADLVSILNIILVGFMFGLYVIYTQDLWGACGLHAAWNFAQANIFGFSVSGSSPKADSLLKFSVSGSDLLTGGAFGPESSIFSTIIISLAIVVLLFKLSRTSRV